MKRLLDMSQEEEKALASKVTELLNEHLPEDAFYVVLIATKHESRIQVANFTPYMIPDYLRDTAKQLDSYFSKVN